MMIEEESGTYTGQSHSHHGYYGSGADFTDVPFTWTKLYPPFMSMPTYPQS
jgi:hypothetical protein